MEVQTLTEVFDQVADTRREQVARVRRLERERCNREDAERRMIAHAIDEFFTIMDRAGRPGAVRIRKMRVLPPLWTRLFGIGSPYAVPDGKKAGGVTGWIIKGVEPGYSAEEYVPGKAGLLLSIDKRIYEFEDALWGGPNDRTPTIHLYSDAVEPGKRGYVPGVDALPMSGRHLMHALVAVIRENGLSPDR